MILLSPVSLPVFEQQETKVTAILSMGDFTQTVDHVTALIACHVFSVTDRPGKGLAVPYLQTCGNCTVLCVLIDLFLFSAYVRPFMLTVVTNGVEYMGVAVDADISNRGFSLSYSQIPCD
jgi:hypothetical protein